VDAQTLTRSGQVDELVRGLPPAALRGLVGAYDGHRQLGVRRRCIARFRRRS
jgi:hypothetical protein